ncbi:hypothetical protein HDU98_001967 [Podochytrium sp. JEL0797]|nr:hypothetical protein HDU98_001967 [Podochytrium sp. JEL0797]
MPIHPIASAGFKQGSFYAASRPGYPSTAASFLIAQGKPVSPKRILEIGSGTGLFTRHLVDLKDTHVTCLEPTEGMRSVAQREFAGVQNLEFIIDPKATAANIPLPSNSVDRIYVAQAFHWFADLPSLREMQRVMKPDGVLGLIWNMEHKSAVWPWVERVRALYEAYDEGVPQYRTGAWKKVFAEEEAGQLFDPPVEKQFLHTQVCAGGKDAIWRRIQSKSYITLLGEQEQESLRNKIMAVLDECDVEMDAAGNVLIPYSTDVATACVRK